MFARGLCSGSIEGSLADGLLVRRCGGIALDGALRVQGQVLVDSALPIRSGTGTTKSSRGDT